jgi:RNA polymerase sigma-70 factor (ECF subfamily)
MDTEIPADRGLATARAEEQLGRRLAQGDEAAYEELWHRFGQGLRRYAAARLGGDEELAEEVAVQSLAACVRSVRSFNPRRGSLASWIYGVARRVVIAELRRQGRRAAVPRGAEVALEETRELAAEGDLASELAARLEARRKVAVLTGHLSDAEMEVLILHLVEEFTLKETARIMGRSERAAYSLLHRAKEKARERLAQDAA